MHATYVKETVLYIDRLMHYKIC